MSESEQPQQPPANPTGESKLFGVSIRSWNATVIIVLGMATVCYLAVVERDPNWVMVILSSALSFLFGKAAGASISTNRS